MSRISSDRDAVVRHWCGLRAAKVLVDTSESSNQRKTQSLSGHFPGFSSEFEGQGNICDAGGHDQLEEGLCSSEEFALSHLELHPPGNAVFNGLSCFDILGEVIGLLMRPGFLQEYLLRMHMNRATVTGCFHARHTGGTSGADHCGKLIDCFLLVHRTNGRGRVSPMDG